MSAPPTSFIAVRHGETTWNVQARMQGHQDSALTAAGLSQAQAVAARLQPRGADYLYASDLGRTRATALPIAAALQLTIVYAPGLRERSYGVFEGLTRAEIQARFPEHFARAAARDPAYAMPAGESALAFRRRVLDMFALLSKRHAGKRVIVVTHAGVLDILYRRALAIALDAPRTWPAENASINRFACKDGELALESWGEVDHLQEAELPPCSQVAA